MTDSAADATATVVVDNSANDGAADALSLESEKLIEYFKSNSISMDDIQTTIKVLNAVSNLSSSKKSKSSSSNENINNKSKKRKKGEEEDEEEENSATNDGGDDDDNNNGSNKVDLLELLNMFRRSKLMRPFRKSLMQCHQKVCQQQMWDGHSSKNEFQKNKLDQSSLKRRKLAESNMQRKHIATTQLRKGRIDKLNSKLSEAQNEEEMKMAKMMMIPDGHVDTADADAAAAAAEKPTMAAIEFGETTSKKTHIEVTTVGNEEEGDNNNNKNEEETTSTELPKLRSCYVCKTRFRELHKFYDQLCPDCASLNFNKRHESRSLKGYTAIVTGSRVKIGYQTSLKLLRAGCYVIATTRFPNSAVHSYRKEHDFNEWKNNLEIYGLDLRDVTGIELFCRYLNHKLATSGLDILINNACQTIRRPTAYYIPQIEKEQQIWSQSDDTHKSLLRGCREYEVLRRKLHLSNNASSNQGSIGRLEIDTTSFTTDTTNNNIENDTIAMVVDDDDVDNGKVSSTTASTPTAVATNATTAAMTTTTGAVTTPFETTGMSHSAASSQMILCPEDVGISDDVLPKGLSDINNQQLDLRKTNSWLLKMDQISTPEVMECMFINAIAPFVLNSKLQPLLIKRDGIEKKEKNGDESDADADADDIRNRYIVNVSAMEGKFYRYKMSNHPHTNMAKSALNMMTRTVAEDLAKSHNIYMNSIDTGWINDENPLEIASRTAEVNNFQTPIDEIDAASRILDPIMTDTKIYGKFLKDYRETEW
jgi:NAD(P)-dependent dehydrogenase (short-subunit alcohol dehydrogenase family)